MIINFTQMISLFPDELVSTLEKTSYSYSEKESYIENWEEKNKWLATQCVNLDSIKTIDFDKLKEKTQITGLSSCDAFFHNKDSLKDSISYLIEFKNEDKNTLYAKHIADENDKRKNNKKYLNSINKKIKDSALTLKEMEFDDGYSNEELVSHTHVLLIYNMDNPINMIVDGRRDFKSEKKVQEKKNRASKAPLPIQLMLESSKEKDFAEIKKTAEECGFSSQTIQIGMSCKKQDETEQIIQQAAKKHKYANHRFGDLSKEGKYVSICSAKRFSKLLIHTKYFYNWDWGVYQGYFT